MDGKTVFGRSAVFLAALFLVSGSARADEAARAALHRPDDQVVTTLHAVGTQNYLCAAGSGGSLAWTFEGPEAALFDKGVQVGRHFAGPGWELRDGSRILGKPAGKADGADPTRDVPWLRVDVQSHAGSGELGRADVVLRTDTKGGALQGACTEAGAKRNVPYEADYTFIHRP